MRGQHCLSKSVFNQKRSLSLLRKQVFWFAVCHFVMFALWKNLNRFCSCNLKLIAFLVPITLIYQLECTFYLCTWVRGSSDLVKYLAFPCISEWLDVVWQWQQRAETIHGWTCLFVFSMFACAIIVQFFTSCCQLWSMNQMAGSF